MGDAMRAGLKLLLVAASIGLLIWVVKDFRHEVNLNPDWHEMGPQVNPINIQVEITADSTMIITHRNGFQVTYTKEQWVPAPVDSL
jgi:hypothetical protein